MRLFSTRDSRAEPVTGRSFASGSLGGGGAGRQEMALVERMLAGDERAMEDFADHYFPGLYRFALSRLSGDTELTREVVQTTVCKALSKLRSFRGESPLFSWLCSCCLNEIRMIFRGRKRAPSLRPIDGGEVGELPLDPGSEVSPEAQLEHREEARQVHAALDRLPSRYQEALEWKYLERLPVAEIARRWECSPKAAESVLSRARRLFREIYQGLADGGGPLSPPSLRKVR